MRTSIRHSSHWTSTPRHSKLEGMHAQELVVPGQQVHMGLKVLLRGVADTHGTWRSVHPAWLAAAGGLLAVALLPGHL